MAPAAAPHALPPSAASQAAIKAVTPLVDRHGPRIHALALRLCRNAADADDLVQDVFLQALRKWHTFRGEADPGTWLYAIAARACKARIRSNKRHIARQVPVSQLMPWTETTVTQLAAAKDDTQHNAQRAEAVARVQSHIARLPEHLRLPVVLKEVLERSVEEVATLLDLSPNTVKTRLHRARLALRKAMTAAAPAVAAPAPIFEKQVCLDLLKAKMEAMDRGGAAAGSIVPQADLCARCRAVFREFDLVQDACAQLAKGSMPSALRTKVLNALRQRAEAEAAHAPRKRGRKPIRRSPNR